MSAAAAREIEAPDRDETPAPEDGARRTTRARRRSARRRRRRRGPLLWSSLLMMAQAALLAGFAQAALGFLAEPRFPEADFGASSAAPRLTETQIAWMWGYLAGTPLLFAIHATTLWRKGGRVARGAQAGFILLWAGGAAVFAALIL